MGGVAGNVKVMLPSEMLNVSSESACAMRGRVKAEARRARVKREFLMESDPLRSNCGIRMRPSKGGVK